MTTDPRPLFYYSASDTLTGQTIHLHARRPPARRPDRDAIAAYAYRTLYREEPPDILQSRREPGRVWRYQTTSHTFTIRHEGTEATYGVGVNGAEGYDHRERSARAIEAAKQELEEAEAFYKLQTPGGILAQHQQYGLAKLRYERARRMYNRLTLETAQTEDDLSREPASSQQSAPPHSGQGFVYLAKSGTHTMPIYKIGHTGDIDRRIKELNRNQPPYSVVIVHLAQGFDAEAMERQLHREFAAYRGNGEWFDLDGNQVAQVIARLEAWRSERDTLET